MCEKVEDTEDVYRMVIHPLCITSRVFDKEKMFCLYPENEKSIITSLAWQKFLPNEGSLHQYGCRVARSMNADLVARGRKLKENNRRVYCGAYHLAVLAIRGLNRSDDLPEILSADVVHEVENNEQAHVHLRITIRQDWEGDIAGTMTAIVDRLWNKCQGPLSYVSDCDLSKSSHPITILPAPPAGGWTFVSSEAI